MTTQRNDDTMLYSVCVFCGGTGEVDRRTCTVCDLKRVLPVGVKHSQLEMLKRSHDALGEAIRQRDEAVAVLRQVKIHIDELEDAWSRGVLREHDGRGGERSNRNVDMRVRIEAVLASVENKEQTHVS